MKLEVYSWNSFSCNNSSDYRLVARFADAKTASTICDDLRVFFEEHATEIDEIVEREDCDPFDLVSEASRTLGRKYRYDWHASLVWGDTSALQGDEPSVCALGDTVVVYHPYMTGFGNLPALLEHVGAELSDGEEVGLPILWVEMDAPPAGKLLEELTKLFEQRRSESLIQDWEIDFDEFGDAWGAEPGGWSHDATYVVEDGHCTFTFPLEPRHVGDLRSYLVKKGARHLTMRIASSLDVARNRMRDVGPSASVATKRTTDVAKTKAATKSKAALTSTERTKEKSGAKKKSGAKAKSVSAKEKSVAKEKTVAKATKSEGFDPSGKSYLFTGKLAAMTRTEAEARAKALGGTVAGSVTPTLDVLVVGDDGSPLYGDGAKGAKLTKAEALNGKGASIRIISETAFLGLKKK